MPAYTVYPNFAFEVEAKNVEEAEEKARTKLINAGFWNFDFLIEEDED